MNWRIDFGFIKTSKCILTIVNAEEIHSVIGVKTPFNRWIKDRIKNIHISQIKIL